MKYILEKYVMLCGYKLLPFALYDARKGKTKFLNKERYSVILDCDGQTEIDPDSFEEEKRKWFDELIEAGIIRESKEGEELENYQKYHMFDNRFKDTVHFSLTGDCNFRCKHCFMSAPDAKFGIPSKEELFDWIDQMTACGIRTAGLTGGEPLFRDDFLEVVEYMVRRGIKITTIYTNGALVSDALLDGLEKIGIHPAFQISFDGVGWHDWLRGIPGAEQMAYDAIELIHKRGFDVACTMAVHKRNKDSIRETVNKLASIGCESLKFGRATDLGCWNEQGEYSLTNAECLQIYYDYIDQYIEDGLPMTIIMAGDFTFDKRENKAFVSCDKSWGIVGPDREKCMCASLCGVVRTGIYLSPEGKVFPCMSMIDTPIADKYPSLKEASLHDILNDGYYIETSTKVVRDLTEHNQKCRDCKYLPNCFGGCRAVAVQNGSTDYLSTDEECCEFYLNGWYEKFKEKCLEVNKLVGAVPEKAE